MFRSEIRQRNMSTIAAYTFYFVCNSPVRNNRSCCVVTLILIVAVMKHPICHEKGQILPTITKFLFTNLETCLSFKDFILMAPLSYEMKQWHSISVHLMPVNKWSKTIEIIISIASMSVKTFEITTWVVYLTKIFAFWARSWKNDRHHTSSGIPNWFTPGIQRTKNSRYFFP